MNLRFITIVVVQVLMTVNRRELNKFGIVEVGTKEKLIDIAKKDIK